MRVGGGREKKRKGFDLGLIKGFLSSKRRQTVASSRGKGGRKKRGLPSSSSLGGGGGIRDIFAPRLEGRKL